MKPESTITNCIYHLQEARNLGSYILKCNCGAEMGLMVVKSFFAHTQINQSSPAA
jgi:hypothetical protein